MTIVFMFPGQSSKYHGMLEKVIEMHPPAADTVARASELIGRDLRKHYAGTNGHTFACNLDVQLGVFLANHLHMELLHARGIEATASLGLSLGEWNHLVHIGAVDFEDALLAVHARGRAYDAGPRGWMASVQPLDLDELEPVLTDVRARVGVVEAVNLNSPTQNVIAGEEQAVKEAVRVLEEYHFQQPVFIEKQVPMHASYFAPVGEQFRAHLAKTKFHPPKKPYLPNRLGRVLEDPTREQLVDLLATHVCRPVLWRASIDHVRQRWPDAVFVEVGPRKVLFNLIRKKWFKPAAKFHVDHNNGVAAHLDTVVGALRGI